MNNRLILYHKIKAFDLEEECLRVYGKNFTVCKSKELEKLINNRKAEIDALYKTN